MLQFKLCTVCLPTCKMQHFHANKHSIYLVGSCSHQIEILCNTHFLCICGSTWIWTLSVTMAVPITEKAKLHRATYSIPVAAGLLAPKISISAPFLTKTKATRNKLMFVLTATNLHLFRMPAVADEQRNVTDWHEHGHCLQ